MGYLLNTNDTSNLLMRSRIAHYSVQKKRGRPKKVKEEKPEKTESPEKSQSKEDPPAEPKTEEPKKEAPKEEFEDEEKEWEKEEEEAPQWKMHRRILYAFGKAFKYTIWASFSLFLYHYYQVRNKDKPEESLGVNQLFLEQAYKFHAGVQDLTQLLTRPPIDKLLPDIPPLPPGAVFPKTLVVNLRGTLVTSEYKFGEGFEFRKRPGLSTFLNRMSQMYEVVVFGDEETTTIHELCQALDPQQRIFQGGFGHDHTLLSKEGVYIKDMSYMNRDIKKIVVIEADENKVAYHKDNVIVLPYWEGDKDD